MGYGHDSLFFHPSKRTVVRILLDDIVMPTDVVPARLVHPSAHPRF